jgi:hypothetical protein
MNYNLVIVVIFVTSILINCSSHLSFAKKNNEKEENDKGFKKDVLDLSIDKNKTLNDILKEPYIHNNNTNILNDKYPNQYFVCGYPKHLIEDYNFLEKINCNELPNNKS